MRRCEHAKGPDRSSPSNYPEFSSHADESQPCPTVLNAGRPFLPEHSPAIHAEPRSAHDHRPPNMLPASAGRGCIGNIFYWLFILGTGSAYGIVCYKLFAKNYFSPFHGSDGLMMVSFIVGVPVCVGALVAYLANRKSPIGTGSGILLSQISMLLFVFIAGAFLREGIICILMALPILLAFVGLGALLAKLFSSLEKNKKNDKMMGAFLFLPLLLGTAEQQMIPPDSIHQLHRSVYIDATPENIWQQLNFPTGIRPEELSGGFAYRIGVPYPIEARTLEPRVGGKRALVWQRGVRFEEEITAWEENRHLAWKYLFTPDSFPEGSLDDHIVIGGKYFGLEDTSYTLTPVAGGTRLDISVKVRVGTHFNWYAGWWAEFLVGDTAETILDFYKRRAEARVQLG